MMPFAIVLSLVLLLFAGAVAAFAAAAALARQLVAASPALAQALALLAAALAAGLLLRSALRATSPGGPRRGGWLDRLEDLGAWLVALPDPFGDVAGAALILAARAARELRNLKERLLGLLLLASCR